MTGRQRALVQITADLLDIAFRPAWIAVRRPTGWSAMAPISPIAGRSDMPKLTITTVDGKEKLNEDTAALEAEIALFEEALQALIPDLESEDDEAGSRAASRYHVLKYLFHLILAKIDGWNEQVGTGRRAAAAMGTLLALVLLGGAGRRTGHFCRSLLRKWPMALC
ncbi:hypothetical protein [Sphingomonas sp. 22176]|uniref:hypothetical protein n=1 Tax=Sphingomonas sp. 22176 TaxID=3453884 RepID=UPI003F859325